MCWTQHRFFTFVRTKAGGENSDGHRVKIGNVIWAIMQSVLICKSPFTVFCSHTLINLSTSMSQFFKWMFACKKIKITTA
jgi:hypothetical protein